MYIVYDTKRDLYYNFMGKDLDEVWSRFIRYARANEIEVVGDRYILVSMGKDREDEIETIRNWFDKEYLTVAIDKIVIDKIK